MIHQMRFTSAKIKDRLQLIAPFVYQRRQPLSFFQYLKVDGSSSELPFTVRGDDKDWMTISWGDSWGIPGTDFILRGRFQVPEGWGQDQQLALYLPIGSAGEFSHPEALVLLDGKAYAACDRHHQEIRLPHEYDDGIWHTVELHGWTGTAGMAYAGWDEGSHANSPAILRMGRCEVVQIHEPTRAFITLARVALGIADHLNDREPVRAHLYNALERAFQVLDTRDPGNEVFYASVPSAYQTLQAGISQSGTPLDVTITAVGHAHIDVAWLWPVQQTRRKAGRTFHNVLRLMDRFPQFHFTQSQPQLYDYVRQDYPELFAAIQHRVGEGRWEPIGGMWVEADCNLTGAESLVRQFLLGRAFFREYFGPEVDSPVLWLPDVFGYAWNLPQLIKGAGLEYFFTIKIGWSQYNRLPYDSFWWQGLDGTRVLTHFSPTKEQGSAYASTYNALARPEDILSTWSNFQQKDAAQAGKTPPLLISYGFGDGGGGPTSEMVENIMLMSQFPATPRVHPGKAADFFRDLERTVGARLPTWNGELYLEYHRGTYTTQARTKRANRKNEVLLHDAEFLAAWAALATAYEYPHAQLQIAWQRLCLNQFHDILPGSSIAQVYRDSARDHEIVRTMAEEVRDEALSALAQGLPQATDYVAINPTSFAGGRFGFLPTQLHEDQALVEMSTGHTLVTQQVEGGTFVYVPHVSAYGLRALQFGRGSASPDSSQIMVDQAAGHFVLENDVLRVVFDQRGDLTSLYDKEVRREVLAPGQPANILQAFEDRPLNWDAWDIDIFFDDRAWIAEPAHRIDIIERGPLRVGLDIRRRLSHSEIVQRVYLYRHSRRLDFDTWVDWRERHVLLKVAFAVNVLSPVATYDVQWGNVQRPTHRNTSWDWARFETCAHKWVDLSEGDYGVSLLNDCKYGHDIRDNVLRLTLLRSPTYPDPQADQGEHRFTYSLLPHPGDWRRFTPAAAYDLNNPLLIRGVKGGGEELSSSLVSVDAANVIIETIKQAEDGRGLIVRLYENERCRGQVTLRAGFPLAQAWRCNLLEEDLAPLPITGQTTGFSIKPYQIQTLRLMPV